MNISTISESTTARNLFIKYSNSFMSNPTTNPDDVIEKTQKIIPEDDKNDKSKGIETLTTFTIFPKQVVNGKTIITA